MKLLLISFVLPALAWAQDNGLQLEQAKHNLATSGVALAMLVAGLILGGLVVGSIMMLYFRTQPTPTQTLEQAKIEGFRNGSAWAIDEMRPEIAEILQRLDILAAEGQLGQVDSDRELVRLVTEDGQIPPERLANGGAPTETSSTPPAQVDRHEEAYADGLPC